MANNQGNKIVDFYVLFLRRAHSPDRPPLDSNPLPTDYEKEHIGRLARMSVLDTEVDCSNPGSSILFS